MNNRSIRTTVAVFIFLLVVLVSVIQYSRIQASTIEPVLALIDVASTGASLVMEQMEVDVFAHLYHAEHEHLVAVPITSAQLNILNVVRVPVQYWNHCHHQTRSFMYCLSIQKKSSCWIFQVGLRCSGNQVGIF